MKLLFVFSLMGIVLATALSAGWDLMFRLFYSMAGVVVVSFFWARDNIQSLTFWHYVKSHRTQVGGTIEEDLTLENTSWLPKLWLEIRDQSTLLDHRGNRVVALGSYAKRSFHIVTPCPVRGEFTLGPITLAGGDPFGLFRQQRRLTPAGRVIVYPAVAPLTSFGRLPGELPGGGIQRQRTHFTTPNAAGVRDYRPGDALRRIHWPSSVRQGRLMVKEFELDPLSEVWLILDLHSEVQAGKGPDSTEEWGVSVCATLANYFLSSQREVGIITQGRTLTADRGYRQVQKALDLLAVVRSATKTPLEEMVASEGVRFTRGATAVIITPSTDEKWLTACGMLEARGVAVISVLLDPSSFGGCETPLLLVSSLAARAIPTYLVRQGDDLVEALAGPAVV